MRYKITQRILAGSLELVWVVWDTEDHQVVSSGSYVSCANACRELNAQPPLTSVLQQKDIDLKGEHRKGFYALVTQFRQMVFPSTTQLVTEPIRKGER